MPDSKPASPYLILLSSLIVPGSGHVWLGLAQRGLTFLFFTVVFAWLSTKLMPETSSFIGRHIGGLFMYGLCALDAYKAARVRTAIAKHE
jgi:hypothetical protein